MPIKEEDNWRLIRNLDKGKYCFLINANRWSIELQEHEFVSLFKLLDSLIDQLLILENQLMDEELINLEFERLPWYSELEGTKNKWSLRIIFEGPSYQIAVGTTPGDDVICGISTKTEFISFWS